MPIQNITLKPINFAPVGFTPIEYKGGNYGDPRFYQQSLANIETRLNQHEVARGTYKDALKAIGDNLSNDPETQQWWVNYQEKQWNDNIQPLIDAGNIDGASRAAMRLAHDIPNDLEVQGRQESWKKYQEEDTKNQQRIGHGVDRRDYELWKKYNGYSYIPGQDVNGNPTKGSYNIAPLYDSFNVEAAIKSAADLVEERSGSTDKDYPDAADANQFTRKGSQWHIKDLSRIQENLNAILKNKERQAQLRQSFEFDKLDLQDLKERIGNYNSDTETSSLESLESQYKELSKRLYKNGVEITDFGEWLDWNIRNNPIVKNLSYDRHGSSEHVGRRGSSGGNTPGKGEQGGDPTPQTRTDGNPTGGDNSGSGGTGNQKLVDTAKGIAG